MVGGEFQWGRRENFSDGFQSDGVKLQFSFKYNFSQKGGRIVMTLRHKRHSLGAT